MSQQRYVANNGTPFALSTTAKTILNLLAGAADRINSITGLSVSIDSSATVLVELCESTQATAGTPGTSGAAAILKQIGGFAGADGTSPAQITAAGNYTAEPTVLTRIWHWRFVGPGPFFLQFPLGRGPESLLSGSTKYKALALRLTASVGTPNADATIEFE
jgi:hypothetical protein